jgi:DNA-binding CsgD family transcriptional regulator
MSLQTDLEGLSRAFATKIVHALRGATLAEIAEASSERARRGRVSIASQASAWATRYDLSATEEAILAAVASGDTREQLARKRTIARTTLKRHIANLLDKTGDPSLLYAVGRLLREVLAATP